MICCSASAGWGVKLIPILPVVQFPGWQAAGGKCSPEWGGATCTITQDFLPFQKPTIHPLLMVELQLSDSSKINTQPSLFYCWWEFGSSYVFVEGFLGFLVFHGSSTHFCWWLFLRTLSSLCEYRSHPQCSTLVHFLPGRSHLVDLGRAVLAGWQLLELQQEEEDVSCAELLWMVGHSNAYLSVSRWGTHKLLERGPGADFHRKPGITE